MHSIFYLAEMKKLILLFSLFFSVATLKAQYIALPDTNFRNIVEQQIPGCFNANGLLDTTCTSLSTVTDLEFYYGAFFDVFNLDIDGIQYLKSLQTFHADGYNIANFAKMPETVTTIRLEECDLYAPVQLPGNLQYLEYFASGGMPASIVLPNSIKYLSYGQAYITALPALPDSLQQLECFGNNLTALPPLPSTLTDLECDDNPSLLCLPRLPGGLTTLIIDSIITCLPNHPPQVVITQSFYNHTNNSLPICDSTNNTNGCITYKHCIWKGTIDSTWEKPGNWSCDMVPDSSTDVIIGLGKVVINSNPVVKTLQETSSAEVIVTAGNKLTVLQ